MRANENGQRSGPGLRRWFVAGGIIEVDGEVLLVENLRRHGGTDWSPPGGVVESGEIAVEGLTREVAEETGLTVTRWTEAIYSVETVAADMGWHLSVQVFKAVEWSGDVIIGNDPDGIVVSALFLNAVGCAEKMAANGQWVREPLLTYLDERWDDHRVFSYELSGRERNSVVVTRR
jgi:8-oxo-dGTP diphosphatase